MVFRIASLVAMTARTAKYNFGLITILGLLRKESRGLVGRNPKGAMAAVIHC